MNRSVRLLVAALLVVGATSAGAGFSQDQSFKVGMPAPPLKVGAWVKGGPVKEFAPGQIYVVEFWATWCHPCIENIPHLTQAAKDYAGQVTVIGVSIQESDFARVAPFVRKMGDQMQYHVAYDSAPVAGEPGFMDKNWMRAAGPYGLPAVFIVGRTGKVEYMGHPANGYPVLEKIVAGTWNMASYEAAYAWMPPQDQFIAAREAFDKTALGRQVRKVDKLVAAQQYPEALAETDILAAMPGATQYKDSSQSIYAWRYPAIYACSTKLNIYATLQDMDGYYKAAEECLPALDVRAAEGGGRSDFADYTTLVSNIVDPESTLPRKDYDFALKVARRGIEKSRSPGPQDYDALAWAYYHKGEKAQAIAAEKKALRLAKDNPVRGMPEDFERIFQKNLALFQSMKQ